jgi:hypothetical protein
LADKPGIAELRSKLFPAHHFEWLDQNEDKVLAPTDADVWRGCD